LRREISEKARIEGVIWQVPVGLRGSDHDFKYRLALIVDGECVLRYDNEAGKGDHRHVGGREEPIAFTAEALVGEFLDEVSRIVK
jgi:hypothetical protein